MHTENTNNRFLPNQQKAMDQMLQIFQYALPNSADNNINFQLWRQDNHPIELTTPVIANQKLHYLHYNPVVAGFIEKPEYYLYSSTVDYYTNRKGLIGIERIDPMIITY